MKSQESLGREFPRVERDCFHEEDWEKSLEIGLPGTMLLLPEERESDLVHGKG